MVRSTIFGTKEDEGDSRVSLSGGKQTVETDGKGRSHVSKKGNAAYRQMRNLSYL